MSTWPKYRSHKIIQALPIADILEATGHGTVRVLFVDEDTPHGKSPAPFVPNSADMRDRASIGDYAVIYEDGYKSVSPKATFEAGYTAIP